MRELGDEVAVLFTQVSMTCDRRGLIGKTMFAIDAVKLPANAGKRSGTHAELAHRATRHPKCYSGLRPLPHLSGLKREL